MDIENRVVKLEDKLEEVDKKMTKLTEDNIRTDEKYKTMVQMMTTMTTSMTGLSKTVNKLITQVQLNDQKTNNNSNALDAITVPKLITIIVGIMAIISFWKGGV